MIRILVLINAIALSLLFSCGNSTGERKLKVDDTTEIKNRANKLYYQGKFEEAKRTFDTLISVEPMQGEWYYKRAYSKAYLLYLNNSVFTDFRKAIALGYQKVEALHNIGVIFQADKNFDSAVYYYSLALELDPENIKARESLYQVHSELKKLE